MEMKKPMIGLFAIAVFILSVTFAGCQTKYTTEEVDNFVSTAVSEKEAELGKDISGLKTQVNQLQAALENRPTQEDVKGLETQINTLTTELETKDLKITDLEEQLSNKEEVLVVEESRYVLDELELGTTVPDKQVSDRELTKLFDGELKFDKEDYEAEEVFGLTGLQISTNKDDYKGNAFLTVPSEGLNYVFTVEQNLATSEIDRETPLEFSLLGKQVSVTEWVSNGVTFTRGKKYFVAEGNSIDVTNHSILVKIVGSDYIYVVVDDKQPGKKIDSEETEEVGGVEIEATEVLYDENGISYATLTIGNEVEYEVKDGEEYEDNSIWEWVITDHTIGLVLTEEYMDLDEDEVYNALGVGNTVCLPNDFVCIRYDGVGTEDLEEYKFDITTRNGTHYVRARGKFQYGLEDYEKVYIDSNGIYDEDFVKIPTKVIDLDDTKLQMVLNITEPLSITGSELIIDDIKFNLELNYLEVAGQDISSFDENYLTNYGILIQDPDSATEDNIFKFSVPQEQLEAELSVI